MTQFADAYISLVYGKLNLKLVWNQYNYGNKVNKWDLYFFPKSHNSFISKSAV